MVLKSLIYAAEQAPRFCVWSWPELQRNGCCYVWPKRVFFVAKNPFFPKKHLQFAETLIFIWEKGTFLFAQLFSVVAITWLELKSGCLIGTEN